MTRSDETRRGGRVYWYQRTWLWVVVAFAVAPVAFVIPGNYLSFDSRLVGLAAVVVLGLTPVGLWMGALVARRPRARVWLSILALIVLGLLMWSVWNGLGWAEAEIQGACNIVIFEDGTTGELNPELCATLDTFDSFRRNVWIAVAATWVAPLFISYAVRRRFQPDDVAEWGDSVSAEVVGWALLTLGGFFLLLTVPLAVGGDLSANDALQAALFVGVPMVSGVLLVRWGRRRRATPPDHTTSEPRVPRDIRGKGALGWVLLAIGLGIVGSLVIQSGPTTALNWLLAAAATVVWVVAAAKARSTLGRVILWIIVVVQALGWGLLLVAVGSGNTVLTATDAPEDEVIEFLVPGCIEGAVEDCVMLYFVADFGSTTEEIGLSCGNRVDPSVGSCFGLLLQSPDGHQTLADQCEAGFYVACDVLALIALVDSSVDDRLAASCGGVREPDFDTLCATVFGYGTRD